MGALLPERGSGRLPERDSRHRPGRDPGRWLVVDLRPQDREAWARLHRGYLRSSSAAASAAGAMSAGSLGRPTPPHSRPTSGLAVRTDLLTYDLEAAP